VSHAQQATENPRISERRPDTEVFYPAIALLIGVFSAVLGLVPGWITGAKLPLQNLWANQVMPDQMPLALLPLSQYEVLGLIALLTTGGAVAGLAIRLWKPAHRRAATWWAVGGVLLVHSVAAIQSFVTLGSGLMGGKLASFYFFGLLAGVILSAAAGLVAVLLFASKSRATTTLGVGLMASPVTSWLMLWAVGIASHRNLPLEVVTIAHWLPATLVGCSLAWCGLKPPVRLVVWALNLVFLWVIPAVFTATQSVVGTRVIAGDIPEMLLMGRQVLTAALGPDGGAGQTLLLAVGVGLAGVAIKAIAARHAAGQQ